MKYQAVKNVKITTLVEDTSPKRPFYGEHGLSLWIETDDKQILFDTGFSGEVLIHNLSILNLDINQIDAFTLSHSHDDHSGGFGLISKLIKNKLAYCPSDVFNQGNIPNRDKIHGLMKNLNYIKENKEIFPGIWIPCERNSITSPKPTKEINLIINLKGKGLVIIVGCAHHGLENIIQDAKNLFNNQIPLYALVGGLHLKDNSPQQINNSLSQLQNNNFKIIAPNHCTGFNALKIITDRFPKETNLIRHTDTGTFHTGMTIAF